MRTERESSAFPVKPWLQIPLPFYRLVQVFTVASERNDPRLDSGNRARGTIRALFL